MRPPGPCAANSARATQIHRDYRERPEQHARIAPAQGHIPEHPNRYRHQLLRQRRMHRVEQRARQDRLEHLPCGRHIMHFIEIEFFRRRHADQKCEVTLRTVDLSRKQTAIFAQGSQIDGVATIACHSKWKRDRSFASNALNVFRFRVHQPTGWLWAACGKFTISAACAVRYHRRIIDRY
jgi:hypothetical protein